jgi:arylsulfatase
MLIAGTAMLAQLCGTGTVLAAPGFPGQPNPPANAPNVLVIMTDDVGFAATTAFGGEIPTPNFDALADNGLKYTNFYTTALCSPTRAALLTGRNQHAVGFGTVPELAEGREGYTTLLPHSADTIAQILSASGYDTAMLGKNHNVPTWQAGSLGPFDQWASGLGFNYFYGFQGGFTDQFHPSLIENTRMVEPAQSGDGTEKGYVLDRDLADHAIAWLRSQHSQHPASPFLLYYAPGTAHAPLQAPAEWIAKFKGRFDAGWDAYRTESFERQKRLGILPKSAVLAPLPDGVRPWAQLSPDERKVAARFMEVYAAQLAYCDMQIGRIVAELKQSGQLDNTLVIFIQGDNGASGEGGELGAFNYTTRVGTGLGKAAEVAYDLAHLDKIGGPESYGVGPAGWAAAMNTPFPYYKVMASRLGGIRNGMVISWPARLKQAGLRHQFAHITDIAPTILDAVGIKAPETRDGVAQIPFDGASFADSFFHPKAPSHHHAQYFEVFGNAAIYQDGWLYAERVRYNSMHDAAMPDPTAPWQLYDLAHDPAQTRDVAAENPDKVAALGALWQSEGIRNHVLPLITNNFPAMLPGVRPEPLAAAGSYTFHPSTDRYPDGVFPSINNRGWSISAEVEVPANGAEGVLATQGGLASGWAFVAQKGIPTFYYRFNHLESALTRIAAPAPLSSGHHHISVQFIPDGPGFARGGMLAMGVDGVPVSRARIEHTVPFKFATEDATIGHDSGTPVSTDYAVPYAFTGRLDGVTITVGPVQALTTNPR